MSCFPFQSVLNDWLNKARDMSMGLLLIERVAHVVAAAGFFFCYLCGPLPYNRKLNVLSASLNNVFPSFLGTGYNPDRGFKDNYFLSSVTNN